MEEGDREEQEEEGGGGVEENGRDTEGKDEVITRKLRRLGERKRDG